MTCFWLLFMLLGRGFLLQNLQTFASGWNLATWHIRFQSRSFFFYSRWKQNQLHTRCLSENWNWSSSSDIKSESVLTPLSPQICCYHPACPLCSWWHLLLTCSSQNLILVHLSVNIHIMKEIEALSINTSELLAHVLIKKSQEMGRTLKSGNKHLREDISTAV